MAKGKKKEIVVVYEDSQFKITSDPFCFSLYTKAPVHGRHYPTIGAVFVGVGELIQKKLIEGMKTGFCPEEFSGVNDSALLEMRKIADEIQRTWSSRKCEENPSDSQKVS